MVDVVVFSCFQVAFYRHFLSILEFESCVRIPTLSEINGKLLDFLRTFTSLKNEGFWLETLLLGVLLGMTTGFFL